jgi:rare lipoprotein A (RlpA)-like double-psi beta-barrel protein
MRMRKGAVAIAAVLVLPQVAGARSVDSRLDQARADRAAALARAQAATADLRELSARYERVAAQAESAAASLIDAYRREATVHGRLVHARATLDARANAAYRAGPAAFVGVLLDSESPADFLARQEMIERTILDGVEEADAALEDRGRARTLRRDLETARARLLRRQRVLEVLQEELAARLAQARAEADTAGVRVEALEEQQRELEESVEVTRTFETLLDAGTPQDELLAMLGPNGGRGCTIPEKLRRTGQVLSGEASFYGEEFAGNPTATGAIFVPELFTAAHKTLPLPSFLHVTYGGRCATVLVNDRGPYVDGRFLDLSEGAATYLGLASAGIGQVQAEILAPA